MTREELERAIVITLDEIVSIKQAIRLAGEEEKKRLKSKLKELQYLQLWHLDLLKSSE